MSHLIIEDIDSVYTPDTVEFRDTWHGLQTVVPTSIALDGSNVPFAFCPIVQCGMKPDFGADCATVPEDLKGELDLSAYKLILADCRAGKSKKVHPLHVPKAGYVIHQNKALFDAMIAAATDVLGKDKFTIATVGTLGGFSQFFVSIAIKKHEKFQVGTLSNGAKDEYKQFFNLNSSHNGLIASNCMLSAVRIVCMNTVQMSISDANASGTASVIKHTASSESLITSHTFAANLKTWLSQADAFKTMLTALKAQKMNVEQFKAFTAGVFTNASTDELSTVSFNRINDMVPLFQRGRGNNGETTYDCINAFTEYFTSGNGAGNPRNVKANKRLATANFGQGNQWKLEAIRTASNDEVFAATVKRGADLWQDKEKVMATAN